MKRIFQCVVMLVAISFFIGICDANSWQSLIIFQQGTSIFLIEYKAYTWDPCDDEGSCYAIACPTGGCQRPAKIFFVKTRDEAEQILTEHGIEHLGGVYSLHWDGENSTETRVTKLDVVPSYTIEDPLPEDITLSTNIVTHEGSLVFDTIDDEEQETKLEVAELDADDLVRLEFGDGLSRIEKVIVNSIYLTEEGKKEFQE